MFVHPRATVKGIRPEVADCDDESVKRVRHSLAAALILPALALAACGGSSSTTAGTDTSGDLPSGHESVLVIDGWVTALRRGDIDAASGYFALPSVVENGTPPIKLRTRADVVTFNSSLPCGAKLVRAEPQGRFITATFRLTERPGGDCSGGTGQLARTAFLIKDGKIVQWRRVPGPGPSTSQPSGPVV
jgi:hypothetical protein